MAEYITLPLGNLYIVPDTVTDQDACFAEPLAAACRVAEQQVCPAPVVRFTRCATEVELDPMVQYSCNLCCWLLKCVLCTQCPACTCWKLCRHSFGV